MNEVEKSIDELKASVDLDAKEKASNLQAKQDSLKSKVKESGVTLERTKNVIALSSFNKMYLKNKNNLNYYVIF